MTEKTCKRCAFIGLTGDCLKHCIDDVEDTNRCRDYTEYSNKDEDGLIWDFPY
jgi:hypothetical protein